VNPAWRAWGIAFALAGTVAVAFRPVFIKLGYAAAGPGGLSPTTLVFLRMMITLPMFAAMAWWPRQAAPIAPRDWWGIVGLGLIGYYAAAILDFAGLQYVPAGVGRLIMFLYPTIVILLSAAFLARRPTRNELAALVMTYAGIALVVSRHFDAGAANDRYLLGVGLIFGSAVCYAIYLVAGSSLVHRVGSARFTGYTMMVSTVPVVIQFLLLEDFGALTLPPAAWTYVLLIAGVCTALPVYLVAESELLRDQPHSAAEFGSGMVQWAWQDGLGALQQLASPHLLGGLLVVSGVLLVSVKRS